MNPTTPAIWRTTSFDHERYEARRRQLRECLAHGEDERAIWILYELFKLVRPRLAATEAA